jgi:two-component system, NtrC family, nitrogen regulation sensor histidine kinase NtrY
VLRHEIMNSVTPIVSLWPRRCKISWSKTSPRLDRPRSKGRRLEDLQNALIGTVINRSRGIMNFVQAYREFTNIPLPQRAEIAASELLQRVQVLFEQQAEADIRFETQTDFSLFIDPGQIEQVLINLIKNALEADYGGAAPRSS